MQKRVCEKILVIVLMSVVALFAIALMALSFGAFPVDRLETFINSVSVSPLVSLGVAFCGLILLSLVIFLMCIRVLARKKPEVFLISENSTGSCFISSQALESLVKHFCSSYQGVETCFTNFIATEDKLMVGVRLIVRQETELNNMLASMNDTLKDYLISSTGIHVGDVDVLVESISDSTAKR